MNRQENINQVNKYVKTSKILKSIDIKDVSSDCQIKMAHKYGDYHSKTLMVMT